MLARPSSMPSILKFGLAGSRLLVAVGIGPEPSLRVLFVGIHDLFWRGAMPCLDQRLRSGPFFCCWR